MAAAQARISKRVSPHTHHALVAGNGPSLDGKSWVSCRTNAGHTPSIAATVAGHGQAIGTPVSRSISSRLATVGPASRARVAVGGAETELLAELAERDWVVFIEGPPSDLDAQEQVLKYLAHYMTGGPMGDRQAVHADERASGYRAGE